jgi:putative redox protein
MGGAVVVSEAGTGRFAQVVSVRGRHTLAADEPVAFGGTDTGPGPYEYLTAGLGACTSMTPCACTPTARVCHPA